MDGGYIAGARRKSSDEARVFAEADLWFGWREFTIDPE
jgi:hypothetical protein